MRSIERSIDIAAPPEAVDAFVHDPAQQPRWRGSLVAWRQDPPGPLEPGTRLHGVSQVAGRRIASTYEVIAVEPGRGSTVRGIGAPVPLTAAYRSDPIPGGTRFTYRITLEGRGIQRVAERVAAAIIGREAAHDLPRLKALVEASAGLDGRPQDVGRIEPLGAA